MVTQLKTSDQRKAKGFRHFPLVDRVLTVPIIKVTSVPSQAILRSQALLLKATNWIRVLFSWL